MALSMEIHYAQGESDTSLDKASRLNAALLLILQRDPDVVECRIGDELSQEVTQRLKVVTCEMVKETMGIDVSPSDRFTTSILEESLLSYWHSLEVLTGVLLQEQFTGACTKMFESTIADNAEPIGILMFTLNTLKIINDDLGYDVGDAALREYVNIIKTTLHKNVNDCEVLIGRTTADRISIIIRGKTINRLILHNIGDEVSRNHPDVSYADAVCDPGDDPNTVSDDVVSELADNKRQYFGEHPNRDGRIHDRKKMVMADIEDWLGSETNSLPEYMTPIDREVFDIVKAHLKSKGVKRNPVEYKEVKNLLEKIRPSTDRLLEGEDVSDETRELLSRVYLRTAMDEYYRMHDALTGAIAPNYFRKMIPEIHRTIENGNVSHGVAFVDLVGIYSLNVDPRYGRSAGDAYIYVFSAIAKEELDQLFGARKGSGEITFARFGGDEFEIVIPFIKPGDDLKLIEFSINLKERLKGSGTLEMLKAELRKVNLNIEDPLPLGCGIGVDAWSADDKETSMSDVEKKAKDMYILDKAEFYKENPIWNRRKIGNGQVTSLEEN